jgi:hypothetical protein
MMVAEAQAGQARPSLESRPVGPCHNAQRTFTVGVSPATRSDRQEVVPMMGGSAMTGWGWLLMTIGVIGF